MSETSKQEARPRQLTMAGWFVIGASVLLVLTAFDRLSGLSSVDRRDSLAETLSQPPFDGLGVTISEALAFMRVGLMVAAACAAAAAVLGIFVLQRHRGARVALSVVAVPLLLSTFVTGDLLGALVAGATLMLWSGPARDWFAGRPVREPAGSSRDDNRSARRAGEPAQPQARPSHPPEPRRDSHPEAGPGTGAGQGVGETPPVSTLKAPAPHAGPPASSGFGRPASLGDAPVPTWSGTPGEPAAVPDAVPVPVKIACVLTWVFSGVVALLYGVVLVVLAVDSDRFVDLVTASPQWKRANLDPDLLLPALWMGCLMFLGWSLGACLLAWFTWRRHGWARWLLAASAATTAVVGLFALPVGLLHQVAAILTVVGLFSATARSWFAPHLTGGRHHPPGPPNGSQSGPPTGPHGPASGPGGNEGHPAWSGTPTGYPGTAPGQSPPQEDKPPVW